MDHSIRKLQIAALSVVTVAVGLGGMKVFSVVGKAKEKKPVAVVMPTQENQAVRHGRYIMSL